MNNIFNSQWFTSYERHSPRFVRTDVTPIEVDDFSCEEIKEIGGWFRVSGTISSEYQPRVLTPYHGRSAVVRCEDGAFVSIKGVGWTWATPSIFRSPKDQQLTFGLFAKKDALHEIYISRLLNAIDGSFSRVLGGAHLSIIEVEGNKFDVRDSSWSNGELIQPCLLYTRQLTPLRVIDLLFLSDNELKQAVIHACKAKDWPFDKYSLCFAKDLGRTVANLHRANGVNDTLESGNVTLCAEITDFEWIYLPSLHHPSDNNNRLNLNARRIKELIYGLELITFLAVRLGSSGRDEQKAFFLSYTDFGGLAHDAIGHLQLPIFI